MLCNIPNDATQYLSQNPLKVTMQQMCSWHEQQHNGQDDPRTTTLGIHSSPPYPQCHAPLRILAVNIQTCPGYYDTQARQKPHRHYLLTTNQPSSRHLKNPRTSTPAQNKRRRPRMDSRTPVWFPQGSYHHTTMPSISK